MLWVLYALLSAFSLATADALTKKTLHKVDDYIIMFSRLAFALPFVLILLFFIDIPKLDMVFLYIILFIVPLEIVAYILYIKAIKLSPLSLTLPYLSLTPLFLILTSFLFLGELPDLSGIIGILLIVLGAYLLNVDKIDKGLFEPLKSIVREKGSIFMIIVAFLFSILSNLGKIAIQHSSPLFMAVFYTSILSIVFFIIVLFTSRNKLNQILLNYKILIFIGLFFGAMIVFHQLAIILTIVPYMISVKRTSMIFAVLYGYFIFREENIRERLLGVLVMFAGVILITLF